MEPGIYTNMPERRYRAIPALSQSILKCGSKSMAHLRAKADHPEWDEETESKVIGSALHVLLLEPDRFDADVIDGPINPKTGACFGVGTKAWAEFAGENAGKIILGPDQREAVELMATKVLAIPEAKRLLCEMDGDNEVSCVWLDPATGLLCKARRDRLTSDGFGIDIKTTRDASPRDFAYSCRNYGYDFQDAWYCRGFAALDAPHTGVVVAVENVKPYEAALYRFDAATLLAAEERIDRLLAEYAACEKAGVWTGYGDSIKELSLV